MRRSFHLFNVLILLLGMDGITGFSSIKAKAKKLVSPPRRTGRIPSAAELWRYSQPKHSKWDVRHTKSFRFQLQTPGTSTQKLDVLPMHKKSRESLSHVLGKGLLWALFKDHYGALPIHMILVETPIPQEPRFVPDVVAFQMDNSVEPTEDLPQDRQPSFWGESGRMSAEKAAALAWKYPHTHFVHLRWGRQTNSIDVYFEEIETAILPSLHHRTAPFQFALLQDDPRRFVDEEGTILIRQEDLQWRTAAFDIDPNY